MWEYGEIIYLHGIEFIFWQQRNAEVIFFVPEGTFHIGGTEHVRVTECIDPRDIPRQLVTLSANSFDKIHNSKYFKNLLDDYDDYDRAYYQSYVNKIYKDLKVLEKKKFMIAWKKLNKKELDELRDDSFSFLAYNPKDSEFPYDVIEWLDLKDTGCSDEEVLFCWGSIIDHKDSLPQNMVKTTGESYEYDDEELLCAFTHYCVINKPT